MNPTRRTQPYREGIQNPGYALHAMQAGKPAFMQNPADFDRYRRSMLAMLLKEQGK